uniref:Putative ovule protein n=1 Tax=Solanum chacoense TaxID=4108 RepID=A0A0V0H0J0_SOLCH
MSLLKSNFHFKFHYSHVFTECLISILDIVYHCFCHLCSQFHFICISWKTSFSSASFLSHRYDNPHPETPPTQESQQWFSQLCFLTPTSRTSWLQVVGP